MFRIEPLAYPSEAVGAAYRPGAFRRWRETSTSHALGSAGLPVLNGSGFTACTVRFLPIWRPGQDSNL